MNWRSFAFGWLLILVPAVLLAGLAYRQLNRDQEIFATQMARAADEQAAVMAERLRHTTARERDDLFALIQRIATEAGTSGLRDVHRHHPLVRTSFALSQEVEKIWTSDALLFGSGEAPMESRYAGLFSGRQAWFPPNQDVREAPAKPDSTSSQRYTSKLEAQSAPTDPTWRTQWRGWAWEDGMGLLCYVSDPAAGTIWGIEVDVMPLLAKVLPSLSDVKSGVVVVRDQRGPVLFQNRDPPPTRPTSIHSLAPELPMLELAWWPDVAIEKRNSFTRQFRWVGGLLVGIFMIALVAGGAWLTALARREHAEARRKTDFVSNVSHELRTPLTTIRLYTELLHENNVPPEKRPHYLSTILAECGRLSRLINNVLDFSRMERGAKSYQPSDINLNEFLPAMIETQRPGITRANMSLTLDLPDNPLPTLRADRDALEQVLLNLLDNACKYAASGKEVQVAASHRSTAVEIHVMDRGPGVPAALREKIFQRFERADTSLTTKHTGAGLGLSIARRLLEDQGGSLTMQPREGGGAIFVISLPSSSRDGLTS